jgi:lipopolysaccharide export system permease protein
LFGQARVILSRYIYREITQVAVALLGLLVLIYLSSQLIRSLAKANVGELPGNFIMQLLALKSLTVIIILVPLTFFLATLIALGRMYADQEVTVMSSCGIGLPFIMRQVSGLALLVALLTGAMALYFNPWAEANYLNLKQEIRRFANVAGIVPGRFKEFNQGQGFLFVEKLSDTDKRLQNIFVIYGHGHDPNKTLLTAAYGQLRDDPVSAALYMELEHGRRYQGIPGSAAMTVTEFEQYRIRIDLGTLGDNRPSTVARSSADLWWDDSREARAELHLRLATPISVLLLLPLAVLLSHSTPRQGRYARVMVAVLIYFTYANLIQVAHKWIKNDQIPTFIGLWPLHGAILVLLLFLLWRRQRI